jgi:hypothetical protein
MMWHDVSVMRSALNSSLLILTCESLRHDAERNSAPLETY